MNSSQNSTDQWLRKRNYTILLIPLSLMRHEVVLEDPLQYGNVFKMDGDPFRCGNVFEDLEVVCISITAEKENNNNSLKYKIY